MHLPKHYLNCITQIIKAMKLLSKYDIQRSDFAQGSNNVEKTSGSVKVEINGNKYTIDFELLKIQPVDFVPATFYTPCDTMECGNASFEFEELTIYNSEIEMTTLDDSGIKEDALIRIIDSL